MPFEYLLEVEPATRPDLDSVRRQIAVLAPVSDAFLIPDNHLGRATVSSLAVAHEVATIGGRSIACINARDRNLLGLQRDLLTAAAYDVAEILLVAGDTVLNQDTANLTVRRMYEEARSCQDSPLFAGKPPFRIGLTTRVGQPVASWKLGADFLLTQVSFSAEALSRWRQAIRFEGPVLAGVLVLASEAMATRLAGGDFGINVPGALMARLHDDKMAGIETALGMIDELEESRVTDGVHLIPGTRYRELAMQLVLRRTGSR